MIYAIQFLLFWMILAFAWAAEQFHKEESYILFWVANFMALLFFCSAIYLAGA